MNAPLLAPSLLTAEHRLAEFSSTLDEWLRRWAIADQANGASGTFVVADVHGRVYGYYALAAGFVSDIGSSDGEVPGAPVPVLVLSRLAVDRARRGEKIGAGLLRDALNRAITIATATRVRVLLVHAVDDAAKVFYQRYGFRPSPVQHNVLMLALKRPWPLAVSI